MTEGLVAGSVVAGQFRVLGLLSQGGMGTVYRVEQISTGAPRALKVMLPQLAADARARERFTQEAQAASRIDSEHVVQVIAAGSEGGALWLAMELLAGDDLATVLQRRGTLPPQEVVEIFRQLGHALAAAHRVGIVHRDLKPENVFIANARRSDASFTVKVLDFGISKWLQETQPATNTTVVGSPLWMAPEQLETRVAIGPTADLWPLGLLAFTLLTGRVYWQHGQPERFSLPMLVHEVAAAPYVPASQRAAELGAPAPPPGFDAWLARCLSRDPRPTLPGRRQPRGGAGRGHPGRRRAYPQLGRAPYGPGAGQHRSDSCARPGALRGSADARRGLWGRPAHERTPRRGRWSLRHGGRAPDGDAVAGVDPAGVVSAGGRVSIQGGGGAYPGTGPAPGGGASGHAGVDVHPERSGRRSGAAWGRAQQRR
jgi:hypothetical protein